MVKHLFSVIAFIVSSTSLMGQPKGNLFIIGGGTRTPQLMQAMLATAQLKKEDYIIVLPMASAETDTAVYYFKRSMVDICSNPIVNFNFIKGEKPAKTRLDSLQKAKLIFIAGGDQSRFMQVVLNTPVYEAIHKAYANGATIAGTSAGAAVMSRYMITGRELLGDTTYQSTYRKVWQKNIEFDEGLGLLDSVIIDQHFIVRSRYNRLLSALAAFPSYPCIGIDESTAIIVNGSNVSVTGHSQVILFTKPEDLKITGEGLIKFSDIKMQLFTPGDKFELNYK
jgi:cyanophycinase